MSGARIVLIGMPGAGKSSVGRALGVRLGVGFADSDELVCAASGRTVTEMFAESEAAFRAAEAAAVIDALAQFPGVLALGGGALLSASVRTALAAAAAPVVLLSAALPTLARRVGDGAGRPLLVADPAARLAVLAAERAELYTAAADVVVATDIHDVATVVDMVLQATIGTGVTS